MPTDSFSTHSLSDFNSKKSCAIKTIQAMNRLKEKNLGTAPDNPQYGRHQRHYCFHPGKKQRVIRNNSGNSTERTTKVSQLIQYFIQLCQHQIYITHTLLIAQIPIQRKYPLFIEDSATAFSTSLTERHKQTI